MPENVVGYLELSFASCKENGSGWWNEARVVDGGGWCGRVEERSCWWECGQVRGEGVARLYAKEWWGRTWLKFSMFMLTLPWHFLFCGSDLNVFNWITTEAEYNYFYLKKFFTIKFVRSAARSPSYFTIRSLFFIMHLFLKYAYIILFQWNILLYNISCILCVY